MTRELFDLSQYRSILCLNGALPDAAFFNQWSLPIIAADGAANQLDALGITPQIIIGDLDSVDASIRSQNKTLYCPEQNTNDYQKSLSYLQEQGLLPTIVVGIHDGYLDHVLNNISIFMDSNNLLLAHPIMGSVINADVEFAVPLNTKISLLGMPSAVISSQGLKWELSKNQLSFPGVNSCFNRSNEPVVRLMVHEGSVLVMVYLVPKIDAGGQD
ncbi:MAG: thiamine diphosphokinase [Legionella sp.]|nr:MAG: thiamine diphosphokinase [Legionella sp.]